MTSRKKNGNKSPNQNTRYKRYFHPFYGEVWLELKIDPDETTVSQYEEKQGN